MTRRIVRRAIWPFLVALVAVGLLFLAVAPMQTFLHQRRDTAAAERQLAVLQAANTRLADRARLLHTDAEIERIAREQYNLVKPGEEAYAILPSPTPPAPPAPAKKAAPSRNWAERLWHAVF